MALPASGSISINAINVEIGRAGTATSSMGETALREITTATSGAISLSNFYGRESFATVGHYWQGTSSLNVEQIANGSQITGISQSAISGTAFAISGNSIVINKPIRTLTIQVNINGDAWGTGTEISNVRLRLHNSGGTIIAYGGWVAYDVNTGVRSQYLTATNVSKQTTYLTIEISGKLFNFRTSNYIRYYVST